MTEPERYFFCHLQKTGGTSIYLSLVRQFGEQAVYPLPDDRKTPEGVLDVDHLRRRFDANRDRLRVVSGHFPLCTTELLGVPFRTFTVLRDPVERILSFLRHQRRLDPELADVSYEEAYGHPQTLHGLIENHMVKMLGLTTAQMKRGALTMTIFDEGHLERAIAALESMDVVGLQSDLAGFHRSLEDRFGWNLGKVLRANTTEPEAASEDFVARIRRDNALDVRLYEHAVAMAAERGSWVRD